MASLNSCQGWSPAEALHTSQGESSFGARRASLRRRFSVVYGYMECEDIVRCGHLTSQNTRLVDLTLVDLTRVHLGDSQRTCFFLPC